MSSLPLSFSAEGFPARFCNEHALHIGELDATIPGPDGPGCWLIEGIDFSATFYAINFSAWYNLNGAGKVYVASGSLLSGARGELIGTWRGRLPLHQGDTLNFGIEVGTVADLAISAWGSVLPLNMGFSV